MFIKTRKFLVSIGMPTNDMESLRVSNKRFIDGSQFRIEIPTINSLQAAEALLNESRKRSIFINRITETRGMFCYPKKEIIDLVELCKHNHCELLMSVGPRAKYDTSASALTEQGVTIGYRLRGEDQLIRAIEDIQRGIELGVRGFLIYDEGLLWVLNKMRIMDAIPNDVKFKVSAHCGHGNPAACRMLEELGADSINPVRDLHISMIAALRAAVDVPLDIHVDNPLASGGFNRVYEAADFIRYASPVYLKTGNSVISKHGGLTCREDAIKMVRQAAIVLEMINSYYPEAIQTKPYYIKSIENEVMGERT